MASPDLVLLNPQQAGPMTGSMTGRVNGRVTGETREPAIFTTRKILRTEHDMMRSADILSGRKGFGISDAGRAGAVRFVEADNPLKPFRLDPGQIEAIQHVTGDSGIAAVVGLAGTGKSTLLAAARLAWESGHHRVLGAALSGKAAEGLEESSGIRSRTLAAWEHAWNNGRDQLMRGDILVIDEAGMVSSLQMARVLDAAEKRLAQRLFWSAMPCSFSRSGPVRLSGQYRSGSVPPNLPVCAGNRINGHAMPQNCLLAGGPGRGWKFTPDAGIWSRRKPGMH